MILIKRFISSGAVVAGAVAIAAIASSSPTVSQQIPEVSVVENSVQFVSDSQSPTQLAKFSKDFENWLKSDKQLCIWSRHLFSSGGVETELSTYTQLIDNVSGTSHIKASNPAYGIDIWATEKVDYINAISDSGAQSGWIKVAETLPASLRIIPIKFSLANSTSSTISTFMKQLLDNGEVSSSTDNNFTVTGVSNELGISSFVPTFYDGNNLTKWDATVTYQNNSLSVDVVFTYSNSDVETETLSYVITPTDRFDLDVPANVKEATGDLAKVTSFISE